MADRVPRNRLSDMDVVEISTVPAGDNPEALVTFWKSAAEKCPKCGASMPDSGKCKACSKVRKGRNPARYETSREIGPMPKTTTQPGGEDEMGEDEVLDAILGQNALLAKMLGAVVGVDPEEDPEGFFSAYTSITKSVEDEADGEYDEDDDFEDEDGDVRKDAKVFDDEYLDDDDLEYEDDDVDPAELLKADPRLASLIAGYESEVAKSRQLAEDAANVALAERDARMSVRFAKSAEALRDLGEDDADMASLLKELHEVCPADLFTAVEATFAKAAHLIATAEASSQAFEETGVPAQVRAIAKASGPSIEELVAQLDNGSLAKGAPTGLTPAQAFLAALEANPGAYDAGEMAAFPQHTGGR